ncbi:MAG: diguanylate cyclase [Actinomycetota bacterium]|nr:diguanylate cyclase [Actinomycetota bacterium]
MVVSASVGIAAGDEEATAATLLRNADIAMYQAKTGGRAHWLAYEPHMRAAAVERLLVQLGTTLHPS